MTSHLDREQISRQLWKRYNTDLSFVFVLNSSANTSHTQARLQAESNYVNSYINEAKRIMMRRCRRSHLIALVPVIIVFLLLEVIHRSIYITNGRPPEVVYQKNASAFLTQKYSYKLKAANGLQYCANNEVDVLLIVPSSVHKLHARAALRESLLPRLPSGWLLVFFLGTTIDSGLQGKVNAEADKFADIIQDSRFLDSYNNLTYKSLALLQWTQKFCADAKYLLKSDDDIYLNIPKLEQLTTCITQVRNNMYTDASQSTSKDLTSSDEVESKYTKVDPCTWVNPRELVHYFINAGNQEYESYFFGGYLYKHVKPDRNKNSKWYLDSKMYSETYLPPFLSGTAYILSTNLISHILNTSHQQPIIHLEDLYISGLIASNGLKLKLSDLQGWSRFRPQWNSVCLFKDLLTVHGLSPLELTIMTSSVDHLELESCNTFSVRISTFLNNLVSHFFPRITK